MRNFNWVNINFEEVFVMLVDYLTPVACQASSHTFACAILFFNCGGCLCLVIGRTFHIGCGKVYLLPL